METERIGRGVSVHRAWQAVLISDFRADQVLSARGLWLLLPMSPSLCEDRLCSNCSVFSLLPFLSHAASLAPKGSRAGRAPHQGKPSGQSTKGSRAGRAEHQGRPGEWLPIPVRPVRGPGSAARRRQVSSGSRALAPLR